MLTAKENMRRTILGGETDRLVNQFEALSMIRHPFNFTSKRPVKGGPDVANAWGVVYSYPENVPGSFPVHTPEKVVIKDIEHWRDYVKVPSLKLPEELWERAIADMESSDSDNTFRTLMITPGIFEQTHHLCGMDNALLYYMVYPDEMKDLIKMYTEWELQMAEEACERLHPEVLFHHDDWGSETNSFLRPEMFEEFFLDAYKTLYGYYHDHGVEFVIHHSDSYGANLVPYMIDMGINVWQGCMASNDVPALIDRYGREIAFMGGIDNKMVDFSGWTQEDCDKAADSVIRSCGGKRQGFLPCITQGGPGSVFPGAYDGLTLAISRYNQEHFGIG